VFTFLLRQLGCGLLTNNVNAPVRSGSSPAVAPVSQSPNSVATPPPSAVTALARGGDWRSSCAKRWTAPSRTGRDRKEFLRAFVGGVPASLATGDDAA
jgi:hypothetical protein